ncbi:DNA topoisomerase 4 subunit B (DUF810) [Wolffia australiana]
MEINALLHRYRQERRELLEFILSAGLASEVRPPPGAGSILDVDLDFVSANYVLERVQSGGVLDLSKACKCYQDELKLPAMMSSGAGTMFFLSTKPEISGPPPRRSPPKANINHSHASWTTKQESGFEFSETPDDGKNSSASPRLNDKDIISFGLPALVTGLSDDDLRETAYEVLVASALVYSGQAYFHKVNPKDEGSKFSTNLKREMRKAETPPIDWCSEVMDMIRIQMEISEAMSACIMRGLSFLRSRLTSNRLDVPQIILVLLSEVKKSNFGSEKQFIKWHRKQENVLEEILSCLMDILGKDEYSDLKLPMSKMKDDKSEKSTSSKLAADLETTGKVITKLSYDPGKFGLPGETYYWTSSYHLHVRLYKKLLFSVFDVLEDGRIVKESEEFLSIFRLTWSVLGITQRLHYILYGHVLFQQYIMAGETILLKKAVVQFEKVISSNDSNRNEEAYYNCLLCFNGANEGNADLSLVKAVLSSVRTWCHEKLQDYHLHFSQRPEHFEIVANLLDVLTLYLDVAQSESEGVMDTASSKTDPKIIKGYIESSIRAACGRVIESSGIQHNLDGNLLRAKLAEGLKLIADLEFTVFSPVLHQWYPESGIVSAMHLRKIYEQQLVPLLETISDFMGNSRSILQEAHILERRLNGVLFSRSKGSIPNMVGMISRPLILQWINSQHDNIMQWAQRTILIEAWEPLSSQQLVAASIVDVFRIIEENVDQFFSLQLPMDIIHLRSLLVGIFQSLDSYLSQMRSNFVAKGHLYPALPFLTRYKEDEGLLMRRKPTDHAIVENNVNQLLDTLTTSKLCVRLNTLHYIRVQIDVVEENIKKMWSQSHSEVNFPGSEVSDEQIEELFIIFDEIRKTSFTMSDSVYDFIGTRIIFWDLRDSFILSLYSGGIENFRLDAVIQQLDSMLNGICSLVIDTLRDQVISSICKASMEGFAWILLDGGPSRAFCPEDVPMLQEDLNVMKELFVASGDGLPRSVVEKESRLVQQILDICSLKTGTIIEMLRSSSEHINPETDVQALPGERRATDADALLRVLCHRKDREASKFLKKHYRLPKSSEYGEPNAISDYLYKSPRIADLLLRSSSARWAEKGQSSFRSMKQKFQEATSFNPHR